MHERRNMYRSVFRLFLRVSTYNYGLFSILSTVKLDENNYYFILVVLLVLTANSAKLPQKDA